jgi:hypothetical protein
MTYQPDAAISNQPGVAQSHCTRQVQVCPPARYSYMLPARSRHVLGARCSYILPPR